MQQMSIKNPATGEEMLSVGEVAEELHISRTSVSQRLKRLEKDEHRSIERYRLGAMIYILRSDVDKIAQPRLILPNDNG